MFPMSLEMKNTQKIFFFGKVPESPSESSSDRVYTQKKIFLEMCRVCIEYCVVRVMKKSVKVW
jgi:hypothetical protein